jgi:hypothetical protein
MGIIFDHDDIGYGNWVIENPYGHVFSFNRNTRMYLVLHSARCDLITPYPGFTKAGIFTCESRIKYCENNILAILAQFHILKDSGFLPSYAKFVDCPNCMPN